MKHQDFYTALGQEMCKIRLKRYMTVHDMACLMQISVSQYKAMEKGLIVITAYDYFRYYTAIHTLKY